LPVLKNASDIIINELAKWEGVTYHPHRFGGVEFRLGKRELGHIHGNVLVDIPFPKRIKNDLVEQGKAEIHHILPESGWISYYISNDDDLQKAIELFKISYNLAVNKFGIKKDNGK